MVTTTTYTDDQRARSSLSPIGSVQSMTSTTVYTAGKGVLFSCSVAGAAGLTMVDGTTATLQIPVGSYYFPFAVTTYTSSSGTMTVYNLY